MSGRIVQTYSTAVLIFSASGVWKTHSDLFLNFVSLNIWTERAVTLPFCCNTYLYLESRHILIINSIEKVASYLAIDAHHL